MNKRRPTLSLRERAIANVLLGRTAIEDLSWPRMSAAAKKKAIAYIEWAGEIYGGVPLKQQHVAALFCLPTADLRRALDLPADQ